VADDGKTGFTVPAQDWVGLADDIEKLVLSPALRAKMGMAMRDKIVTRFGSRRSFDCDL